MRATATLFATLALALGAIGLAVAAPGGGQELARADVESASGSVLIANSRAGQAVLDAPALRPGASQSGTVTIGNDGDVGGRFSVVATSVQETPGAHGGRLSARVQLLLVDETDPQDPVTVYAGTPAGFGELDLGTLDAGEERDYRLEVALPNGGAPASLSAGDNRFQGAALSLGLQWRAAPVEAAAPTPTPTPTAVPPVPTPTPAPPTATPTPPTPTPTTPLADAVGMPTASTCVKGGRLTLRLKGPNGTKVVSATVAVNGRVKARVKGAEVRKPVVLRGLGKKTVRVKVAIKAGDRRTYTATRSYRPCTR